MALGRLPASVSLIAFPVQLLLRSRGQVHSWLVEKQDGILVPFVRLDQEHVVKAKNHRNPLPRASSSTSTSGRRSSAVQMRKIITLRAIADFIAPPRPPFRKPALMSSVAELRRIARSSLRRWSSLGNPFGPRL